MDPSTTLLLVRHGQSLANAERRFTLTDDEPLTALGVEQARDAGRRLAASYRPTVLYCSSMLRAAATAREIGRHLGLEPTPVHELCEQSFGELRGRPYADYYPEVLDFDPLTRWAQRAPGGESLREVADRVGPVLDRLVSEHPEAQVVVVSHGGVMAALRGYVAQRYDLLPVPTPNAGGYRLVGQPDLTYRGPLELFEEHSGESVGVGGEVSPDPSVDPMF